MGAVTDEQLEGSPVDPLLSKRMRCSCPSCRLAVACAATNWLSCRRHGDVTRAGTATGPALRRSRRAVCAATAHSSTRLAIELLKSAIAESYRACVLFWLCTS